MLSIIFGSKIHEPVSLFPHLFLAYAGKYWEIVFRGVSGKSGGTNYIFRLWTGSSTRHENNADAKRIGSRFSGNYKSAQLIHWRTSTFTKVF